MPTELQQALITWDHASEPLLTRRESDAIVEAARKYANLEQIGWFDPASKRFCYSDEKEAWPDTKQGYVIPVFAAFVITEATVSEQRLASN
jgi:hypothetical protein